MAGERYISCEESRKGIERMEEARRILYTGRIFFKAGEYFKEARERPFWFMTEPEGRMGQAD